MAGRPPRGAPIGDDRDPQTAPGVTRESIDRLLASRALHRMSWEELLVHSRDPLGEFAAGRYKALAKAELESVGLRSP